MKIVPEDVNISVSPSSAESLHEVFREVRNLCMTIASSETDLLIDIGENSDGMPEAEIFRDGKLERKVFATFS
jgi:hypothetical protein